MKTYRIAILSASLLVGCDVIVLVVPATTPDAGAPSDTAAIPDAGPRSGLVLLDARPDTPWRDLRCDPFGPPTCDPGWACVPLSATSGECRDVGADREGNYCRNFFDDCAAGLACIAIGGDRECRRYCRTDADCGSGLCVCSGPDVASGVGTCSSGCQPGHACAGGWNCELVVGTERSGGECSVASTRDSYLGGPCVPGAGECETIYGAACVPFSTGPRCEMICEGVGRTCDAAGRACARLPTPAWSGGIELGWCPRR